MAKRHEKRQGHGSHTTKGEVIGAKEVEGRTFGTLGLSEKALAAVSDLGYEQPTPVQAAAIPAILAGRDVMAAAQTGTGKTAAFLLPALDTLERAHRGQGPFMLVVTPTRELAAQIEEVAQTICARTGHHAEVLVGGVSYEPQRAALKHGCDLLVATPGRLLDLVKSGDCDLSQVGVLVLDEADRMLDMGFLPDVRRIVKETSPRRQTLLFSATLTDDVLDHTKSLVRNPVRVEIAPEGVAADTIRQYVLPISYEAKTKALIEVLKREGSQRVIVFVRGKHRADAICRRLRKAGFSCAPIHGNRSQNQRMNALRRFDEGEVDILVATDVLARGIDIADVSYVVNLDVPSDPEDYIHRIGRTGRAGEQGWSLTLASPEEEFDLREIEKLMDRLIEPYPRADGIDLGEDPLALDPDRSPHDRLPGKKERKRITDERKEARKARTSQGRLQQGGRVRKDDRKKQAEAEKPRRPQREEKSGKTTRPQQKKAAAPAAQRTQKSQAKAPVQPRQQRRRRHPGDHGGRQAGGQPR